MVEEPISSLDDMAARAAVIAVIRIEERFERPQVGDDGEASEEAPMTERHARVRVVRSSDPTLLETGAAIDLYLALTTTDAKAIDVVLVGEELDAAYQPGVTAVVGLSRTESGFSNSAGAVIESPAGLLPVGRPDCYGGAPSKLGDQVKDLTADSAFDALVALRDPSES